MALDKADDGKRQVVKLTTGELLIMRASEPVRPHPHAEIIIRKF